MYVTQSAASARQASADQGQRRRFAQRCAADPAPVAPATHPDRVPGNPSQAPILRQKARSTRRLRSSIPVGRRAGSWSSCRLSGQVLTPGHLPSVRGARMSASCVLAACERHEHVRHAPACQPLGSRPTLVSQKGNATLSQDVVVVVVVLVEVVVVVVVVCLFVLDDGQRDTTAYPIHVTSQLCNASPRRRTTVGHRGLLKTPQEAGTRRPNGQSPKNTVKTRFKTRRQLPYEELVEVTAQPTHSIRVHLDFENVWNSSVASRIERGRRPPDPGTHASKSIRHTARKRRSERLPEQGPRRNTVQVSK